MVVSNNQLNRYKFTLKHESCPDKEVLIKWMKANCKKWVFQLEKGDTGYVHFQGRFSLMKKRRKSELVHILQQVEELKTTWLSPEVTTNDTDFYETKEDTRIEGPWRDVDKERYIPRQCREIMDKLRPWQKQIQDDCGKWNVRKINLIYDPVGNIGKSTFVGLLGSQGLAQQLPVINDYRDLLAICCDMPTANMYLIDMPRAIKKDKLGGLYSGIESIKSGFAFDTRYRYREKYFDSPNIWVFTNILPAMECLSTDRWIIWQVDEEDWCLREVNIELLS